MRSAILVAAGAIAAGCATPAPAPGNTSESTSATATGAPTAGVTSAERRSAITTPVAPAHSAERQIAPRFWGSWI